MTSPAEIDTETLAVICGIFAEILGKNSVQPEDGFRGLGGDSLRAVKAVGRIAVEFGTPDETNERLLEALLDDAGAGVLARLVDDPGAAAVAVPVGGLTADRALSFGEERLWLAQRYYRDTTAYHVVNAFRVAGDLDLGAFDRALRALVRRHPALRTSYSNQAPRVTGDDAVMGGLSAYPDIGHHEQALPWPKALAMAADAAIAPFDLAEGQLLRVRSYRTADGDRMLLVVVHHIATDGWSMGLVYAELAELYAGRPLGSDPPGYHEFARWQRGAGEPIAAADAFAARLGSLPDRIELGRGRQRPPARSLAGSVLRGRLPAATADRLRALATESGSSLYVVLLAAFSLCLARRTRQWDLLVGTVVAARTQPRFHGTVGFFANTLPVRVTTSPDTAIADLLDRLGAEMRWVLTHQDVPLEELAIRARGSPDRAHGPLVDAVLVLQSDDGVLPEFTGCAVTAVPLHTGTAKFDLMLEVAPSGGSGDLGLSWEYATDVLDARGVAELAASFGRVAAGLAAPGATVRSVTGLSAAERRRIAAVGETVRAWPDTDISALFEHLAVTGPDLPAVLQGPVTVDRAELRRARNRLAGCLAAHEVRAGDVVAVHLPRSADSVAALLAIWWIGAVPVFIDVHHPVEHRNGLARACRPAAVLTCDIDGWPAGTLTVRPVDAERMTARPGPFARRGPADAAWLVATSGSTGAPKITVGTHRGLRNRCAWAWESFPFTGSEIAALRTPVGFVDAIAEAAVPLLAGVPLAVVPDRAVWDARELADVLGRCRVTRLLGTPSMLRHLLDVVPDLGSAAPALRWCASSGEPLEADLLGRLRAALPRCRFINLYGSSEVAGDATYADVTDLPAGRPVPIGRPIANTGVLVVDGDGELVPPGAVGELLVTGAAVGLGYLVDGNLAASGGFRAAPGGGRGYWTGDLGWLGPDGLLYFAGRRDRQVKTRGCRVELGQVEAAMLSLAGLRQAAAWADRDRDGAKRICAAAVPMPGTALSSAGLRAQLRDRLPSYMVPARLAVADALPLTVNGKLDRAAAARLSARQDVHVPQVEAMSDVQHQLRLIWSTVLDGELAGLDDDFFALGGDSLAANTMLAAVMRDTGSTLSVGDFLARPTIRALADRLSAAPPPDPGTGELDG